MVVIALNKESATWKDAGMKTVTRDPQLKYIDSEGMRVVTKKCKADKIKSDRVESIVMKGVSIGTVVKVGKLEKFKTDEETGNPPLEALKSSISIAANHMKAFESCTSTCEVHTFVQSLRDLCWHDRQWRTEWAPMLATLVC